MERAIEQYTTSEARLVFISDGACWIKNWIEDSFGERTISILDAYHALEYLHEFCREVIKGEKEKQKWIEENKALLMEGKVTTVMETIDKMQVSEKAKEKILRYYSSNQQRMAYDKYRLIGTGIIGSGAIESAHRTVIQKRMKLSGQRWSNKGAKHMLKLRITHMNQSWGKVIMLAKKQYQKAA